MRTVLRSARLRDPFNDVEHCFGVGCGKESEQALNSASIAAVCGEGAGTPPACSFRKARRSAALTWVSWPAPGPADQRGVLLWQQPSRERADAHERVRACCGVSL